MSISLPADVVKDTAVGTRDTSWFKVPVREPDSDKNMVMVP